MRPFARTFRDQIYRVDYVVVCCGRTTFPAAARAALLASGVSGALADAIRAKLDAYRRDGDDGQAHTMWSGDLPSLTCDLVVLWVRSGADVTTLAHEALHAALAVVQSRGVKVTAESEEAVCYYHQWIMRCALRVEK